jgi:hypothetical protein
MFSFAFALPPFAPVLVAGVGWSPNYGWPVQDSPRVVAKMKEYDITIAGVGDNAANVKAAFK